MTLASILGVLLWLLWPHGGVASDVNVLSGGQQGQPNSASQQSSLASPESDQQKSLDQPAATSPPCPANSQSSSKQSGATAKPNCAPQKSSAATAKKHHRTHKPAATTGTDPTKTVVRNGGTTEPAIDLSPNMSEQQASNQRAETDQRLEAANSNLKKAEGRQLSSTQQDTVKQVKNYMEQAETAKAGGDMQRAYNLAVKANLLSAELAAQIAR